MHEDLVKWLREKAVEIARILEDAADAVERLDRETGCVHRTSDGRCGDPFLSTAFCIGAACPDGQKGEDP